MLPAKQEVTVDSLAVEQVARVEAMLARWAAEDISDEPEWELESIEPVTFAPAARSV